MTAPSKLPAELAELEDDYQLLAELGRGGAGVVYRARDRALGREVAVKVVHPRPAAPDDDPVTRLAREARTAAQLQHPNIVAVYAVRRLRGGGLALVMQCVPGPTLKTLVQREGPLAPARCERVLRDVAEALAYAHVRGVVHRDVKPENIFLDDATGRALLADFGIARSADADSMTMTGTALGTPFYMSPEQVDGGTVDGRSDLYSLGLVAWETLTGLRPWDGESLYNVIYKQKHDELPPIEALRPGVPPRLQYVVERMLQKHPGARWAGAEGLLAQLGHAVLPGDFARWQASLPARVERYRRDAARRTAPPTGGAANVAPNSASPTVQFARAHAPTTAGHAEPASDGHTLALPAPGRTIDLHADEPAALTPIARRAYADVVEPSWSGLDAGVDREVSSTSSLLPARRTRMLGAAVGLGVATWGGAVTYARWPGLDAVQASAAPSMRPTAFSHVDLSGAGATSLTPPARLARQRDANASLLAAGGRHSCALTRGGALHCWGANERGQLGDGTTARRPSPVAVAGSLSFAGVAVGLAHSCAVTRLGDVYCWGADAHGQLGDATAVGRTAPVRVAGPGTYTAVSAGAFHSCAVTSQGEVRCWGSNDQGQLGDGTRVSRAVPGRVLLEHPALAVSAGEQHSCALIAGGQVLCWGANADGQLGTGAPGPSQLKPVAVTLPRPAISVTTGPGFSCAVTNDGAGWCWGRNEFGQLGIGSRVYRAPPTRVQLTASSPLVAIAGGAAHACALDAGGTVWCWGHNTRGAVGDGGSGTRSLPRVVPLPARATAVAAGASHGCATLATDRTICWGDDGDGQLGDGLLRGRGVPTAVRFPPGVVPLASGQTLAER